MATAYLSFDQPFSRAREPQGCVAAQTPRPTCTGTRTHTHTHTHTLDFAVSPEQMKNSSNKEKAEVLRRFSWPVRSVDFI